MTGLKYDELLFELLNYPCNLPISDRSNNL